MRHIIHLLIIVLLIISCKKQTTQTEPADTRDIFEKLTDIPGIRVTEIEPKNGFDRQFELYLKQPLDHKNPDGPSFEQRIFISHTNSDGPVVLMPSGYSSSPIKICELAQPLQANQIYAAHRFMLGAKPQTLDWQFLTIEQASADFHRVVETLSQVYPGPWLSYGASKNGQTALFHRRFYPQDVLATVALVAPLSRGTDDPRYEAFLETAGTTECRDKIKQFQRTALVNREAVQSYINSYINQSDFTFSRMSASEILEFEILEFPFSSWQVSDGDCSSIPDSNASAYQLYSYIKNFGYLDFYSDEMLDYFAPVYYQAYTEMGWYRLVDDDVKDLLLMDPSPTYRMMAPQEVPLVYNQTALEDIRNWLQGSGNNIIYLYGENDPWTAGAIESVGATNALKIIESDANHSLKIENIANKDLIYSRLEEWLGISISQ